MAIQILGPDGSINTFPDGTSDNVIKSAMGKLYPPQKKEAVLSITSAEPPTAAYEDYTSVVTPPKEQKKEDGFYSLLNKISKDTDKRLAENANKSPFLKEMLEGRQARQNVIDEQRAMELQQPPPTSEEVKEEVSPKEVPEKFLKDYAGVKQDAKSLAQTAEGVRGYEEAANLLASSEDSGLMGWINRNILAPSMAGLAGQTAGGIKSGVVLGRMASSPVRTAGAVAEILAPETTKQISEIPVVKEVSDYIDKIVPEASSDEKIAADLASIGLAGLGGAKIGEAVVQKLAQKIGERRALQIATKINQQSLGTVRAVPKTAFQAPEAAVTAAKVGAGTTAASLADVAGREQSDQTAIPALIKVGEATGYPKEVLDLAKQLQTDPNNPDLQDRRKQLLDSYAGTAIAAGVFKLLAPVAKAAAPYVGNAIAEINTGLGRAFKSTGNLPPELAEAALKRSNAPAAYELELKRITSGLQKAKDEAKASDADVNTYLSSGVNNNNNLPKKLTDKLDDVRNLIQGNQDEINIALNQNPSNGIGAQYKNGNVYLTRTFEAVDNPNYLKAVEKALTGKQGADPNFVLKVDNARTYLQGLINSKPRSKNAIAFNALTPAEQKDMLDSQIFDMVKNLSGENKGLIRSIFEDGNIGQRNFVGQEFVKVLKKRKELDLPLLDLFGEVKDPVRKAGITLQNQHRLLSELEYIQAIEDFANQNANRTIDLGGLIGFLPTKKTVFATKPFVNQADLSELPQKFIGKYGTSSDLLKDVYTTPQMAEYLSRGTNLFAPEGKLGKGISNAFAKIAGFGQSTQTVLDAPAYVLNTIGASQMFAANGHLLNPVTYKKSLNTVGKLWQQVAANDKDAIAYLQRLKEQGVIDSSLTGEVIKRNADLYGNGSSNFLMKYYRSGMQKAGELYSQPDNYFKLLAHQAEMDELKKIFPNISDADAFMEASRVVRDTMPSYSVTAPFARELSKMPFGTYALYPTEVIRTTKNIVKYGAKDIMDGLESGNIRQVWRGARRLGSAGTVMAGMEIATRDNNSTLGVTPQNERAIHLLSPDWGKGANHFYLDGFKENKDGNITTRYASSNSFDAYDSLKVPVRLITGKLLGGNKVSDAEIDDAMKGIADSVIGPYTNPKFFTEALINVVSGTDQRTGKPLYDKAVGATKEDKIKAAALEIAKSLEPGTSQVIRNYIDSLKSEELRGIGEGVTASGFPLNSKDIKTWMTTGIRPTTVNLDKAVGFNLSKDIKAIKATDDDFYQYINQLKDKPFTDDVKKDIVDKYVELQNRKFNGMRDLSDKLRILQDVTYYDKNNNVKNFGFNRIVSAATDKGFYKFPEEIAFAKSSLTDETRRGVFMPDNPAQMKELKKLLIDKQVPKEQVKILEQELLNEFKKLAGKSFADKRIK